MRRLLGRRAAREAEQRFVIEGAGLLAEALAAGALIDSVYVAPAGRGLPEVADAATAGAEIHELAPGVIERVAATVTPQPVAAIVGMRPASLEAVVARAGPLVVCVDIRDPGNLGTVVRSAEASGAAGVVCCDGTVDVYNPKCVRASAGSLFHVPIVVGSRPASVLEAIGAMGRARLGAVASSGVPYDEADLVSPVAVVLGNEANGLSPELSPVLDGELRIPMEGRTESLNVGMACAVLCFEAARQRRERTKAHD